MTRQNIQLKEIIASTVFGLIAAVFLIVGIVSIVKKEYVLGLLFCGQTSVFYTWALNPHEHFLTFKELLNYQHDKQSKKTAIVAILGFILSILARVILE